MSLLTLERSSPSPHESENEDLQSTSSYEGFVAREHYALSLSPRPFTSLGPGRSGDQLRIFSHLKKLVKILRTEDMLRMAVELENGNGCYRKVTKYLVIITTNGHMGTEETIVLGTEQDGNGASNVRICLVLPLWRDTEIKLDGDGGFSVHTGDRHQVFKPSSVQSMWAALQMLYKSTQDAQTYNYYVGGLSHTWMSYYSLMITTDGSILNEWNLMEDVESFRPDYGSDTDCSDERVALEKVLTQKLREVMLNQDLEEVTCRQLRLLLEKEVEMDLKEYKGFLDQQMLRILGQMERPSQIFDYLYLGSEWNASHLQELKELGVKYILNISREIDNFYPEEFKYLNIRLYDLPNSQLMKHWDKTYTFLKEAKESGKKALVHCKMGISRSAATVTAYAMKEYKMSLDEALHHVKSKRGMVNPNDGFIYQLRAYEGILKARHNELWGKQAPSRPLPLPLPLYKSHSLSESNLPDMLNKKNLDNEPELSFLEERDGNPDNSQLLHVSSNHLDEDSKSLGNSHSSHFSSLSCFPLQSTSIDKTQNIKNFLASLPNVLVEDDQGLGENMMCNSDSGSGYSSPVSTPTDDDHLHSRYSKHIKEIRRESKMTAEQIGEENKEGGVLEERTPNQDDEPIEPSEEKHLFLTLPKRSSPVYESEFSNPVFSPIEEENQFDTQTSIQNESRQPVADIPIFQGIPTIFKSTSLPQSIMIQYQDKEAMLTIPSSIHQCEDGEDGSVSVRTDQDLCKETCEITAFEPDNNEPEADNKPELEDSSIDSTRRSNDHELFLSPTTERVSLSQRGKSHSVDVSGPIKLPQIQSVPERIKQIEEMNMQNLPPKSTSVPPGSCSIPLSEIKDKCDFFIPKDDDAKIDGENTSITRTSSGHSISSSGDEELKQIALMNKSLHHTSTRHSSLSPNPSLQQLSTDTHFRPASCSYPCSLPLLDLAGKSSGESSVPGASMELGQLGTGAVKARVHDIEERNRDEKSNSSDELSGRKISPAFQPRSSSSGDVVVVPETSHGSKDFKYHRPRSEIVQPGPHPSSKIRESTPPAFLSAWNKLVDDIPTLPVQDLKRKFEESYASSVGSSYTTPKEKLGVKTSKLRRSQSLKEVNSPSKMRYRFKGKSSGKKLCLSPWTVHGAKSEKPCSQN